MELKDQFCTVELAGRLIELGVKPVATFYHMPPKDGPHGEYIQYGWSSGAITPAYNLAELHDMMPTIAQYQGRSCEVIATTGRKFGQCELRTEISGQTVAVFRRPSATQAFAALLIYLLEDLQHELPERWRQDPNDPCSDGRCKLPYSKDMEEIIPMPVPTEEDLKDPRFKAMWQVMKTWTIRSPEYYTGYKEANGRHVKLLLDAQKEVMNESNPIPGKIRSDH